MMTIGSVTGTNNSSMQSGYSGINMQTDSVSKNIQNQIARANEKLQELSSNEEMTMEQKMKQRQEIQQEIADLNRQLRQHQIEKRNETQSKGNSMEDMLGGSKKSDTSKADSKGAGLSQASMEAMISADSSIKQSKVQGSMATQMKGRARVLESEIKMDKGRGADTEKKEEELANLKARAQATKEAQISTLADAGKVMEEAAKTEQSAENTDRTEQSSKGEEKSSETIESAEESTDNNTAKPYISIDVRL